MTSWELLGWVLTIALSLLIALVVIVFIVGAIIGLRPSRRRASKPPVTIYQTPGGPDDRA